MSARPTKTAVASRSYKKSQVDHHKKESHFLQGLTQRIASAIFLVKDMAEAYINVSLMPGNAIRSIKQMSQKHVTDCHCCYPPCISGLG